MKVKPEVFKLSKYKKAYCKDIIFHMEKGFSFESFCGVVFVNQDTLYEWAKRHPEFAIAKQIAFERNRLFWEKVGIQAVLGKIDKVNASIWIFNMKNRFQWRDKQPDEETEGNKFEPIVIDLPNVGRTLQISTKDSK